MIQSMHTIIDVSSRITIVTTVKRLLRPLLPNQLSTPATTGTTKRRFQTSSSLLLNYITPLLHHSLDPFHPKFASRNSIFLHLDDQQQLHRQRQQLRFFGKLLRKKKGKKDEYYSFDECKLQICYSDYDLTIHDDDFDEDTEDTTFLRARFTISSIKDAVEDVFDDSRNIQYYDSTNKEWKELKGLSTLAMLKYRAGQHVLRVRVPLHYDDSVPIDVDDSDLYEDNEDYNSDDYDDDGNKTAKRLRRDRRRLKKKNQSTNHQMDVVSMTLELTIKKLVSQLQQNHYERSESVMYGENNVMRKIYTLTNTKTKEKIYTTDWVMEQIVNDIELQKIVLNYCGAFDHIVQCIHYNILWEYKFPSRRLHKKRYRRRR